MPIIVILFISLTFLSCVNPKSEKDTAVTLFGGIERDMPERFTTDTLSLLRAEERNKMLNLSSLFNGYDGLQIRIWISCDYRNTHGLILINQRQSLWEAKFYYYLMQYKEDGSFDISDIRSENKLPKSGWKTFSDSLLQTGITDLPDFTSFMPKYNLPTDGWPVTVEVGTPKKYKLYEYPELDLNKNIEEGPAKLEEALLLIEQEFNYTRPCQQHTEE